MSKYLKFPYLKWGFIGIISFFWLKIFLDANASDSFNWHIAVNETGYLAWFLLIFTIFISLLQKITALHWSKFSLFNILLPLRKYSGIFAFLIVLSHMVAEFLKQGILNNFGSMVEFSFSTSHAAVFGTISFLIMLPLFLTSTSWAAQKMGGRAWKNLQRFTHLAFILAGLHIALINYFYRGTIEFGPLVLITVYLLAYLYLFLRKKLKKSTL